MQTNEHKADYSYDPRTGTVSVHCSCGWRRSSDTSHRDASAEHEHHRSCSMDRPFATSKGAK